VLEQLLFMTITLMMTIPETRAQGRPVSAESGSSTGNEPDPLNDGSSLRSEIASIVTKIGTTGDGGALLIRNCPRGVPALLISVRFKNPFFSLLGMRRGLINEASSSWCLPWHLQRSFPVETGQLRLRRPNSIKWKGSSRHSSCSSTCNRGEEV
jgi:hypothetical protein